MSRLRVEVVYALAAAQARVTLELPDGASVGDAVAASGLAAQYQPQSGLWRFGIGGRQVQAIRRLRDGDRVEILRPLAADPKEARRLRARGQRRRQAAGR